METAVVWAVLVKSYENKIDGIDLRGATWYPSGFTADFLGHVHPELCIT